MLREARDVRELPPYAHYDPTAPGDGFVNDPDIGREIYFKDPDLVEIERIDVPGVIRKLRVRAGLPVEPLAVDPDDPFANGLSAVRYENVFGRRPRA